MMLDFDWTIHQTSHDSDFLFGNRTTKTKNATIHISPFRDNDEMEREHDDIFLVPALLCVRHSH